jgi:hypothetical protein
MVEGIRGFYALRDDLGNCPFCGHLVSLHGTSGCSCCSCGRREELRRVTPLVGRC